MPSPLHSEGSPVSRLVDVRGGVGACRALCRRSFGPHGARSLSELDTAILRELQNNARRTNRAIAETVHVAASTSLERIRSLRERGVIRGYHAEADLAALGREVQALIAIRIRPPSRENIEAFRD